MSNVRYRWKWVALGCLLLVLALTPVPVAAAPPSQDAALASNGPAENCAEGVQLFLSGEAAKARPLVESGIANRGEGADRQDLNRGLQRSR